MFKVLICIGNAFLSSRSLGHSLSKKNKKRTRGIIVNMHVYNYLLICVGIMLLNSRTFTL